MSSWLNALTCCLSPEDEETAPVLVISGPTNFRRESITLQGLSEIEQSLLRMKSRTDAEKMWANLRPLASAPSEQFALRPRDDVNGTFDKAPAHAGKLGVLPPFEAFVAPRAAPRPLPACVLREDVGGGALESGWERPGGDGWDDDESGEGRGRARMLKVQDGGMKGLGVEEEGAGFSVSEPPSPKHSRWEKAADDLRESKAMQRRSSTGDVSALGNEWKGLNAGQVF